VLDSAPGPEENRAVWSLSNLEIPIDVAGLPIGEAWPEWWQYRAVATGTTF
jgi:hypothetical protein